MRKLIIESALELGVTVALLACGTVLVLKGHSQFEAPVLGVFVAAAARGIRSVLPPRAAPTEEKKDVE